ncbi:hypothetical protein NP493_189g04011 [Ridgeia piscesae]|uniref:Uncharacterized protein n=1 Tax=Ridgeia piscesae TaxID=27915 RepID=A0AAD9P264_RIDPI|nr:hypothetical protein NP493_189g04011 [Ridgeia piscesae]
MEPLQPYAIVCLRSRQPFVLCTAVSSDDGRFFIVERRREEWADRRARLTEVPIQEDTRIAAGGIRVVAIFYVLYRQVSGGGRVTRRPRPFRPHQWTVLCRRRRRRRVRLFRHAHQGRQ